MHATSSFFAITGNVLDATGKTTPSVLWLENSESLRSTSLPAGAGTSTLWCMTDSFHALLTTSDNRIWLASWLDSEPEQIFDLSSKGLTLDQYSVGVNPVISRDGTAVVISVRRRGSPRTEQPATWLLVRLPNSTWADAALIPFSDGTLDPGEWHADHDGDADVDKGEDIYRYPASSSATVYTDSALDRNIQVYYESNGGIVTIKAHLDSKSGVLTAGIAEGVLLNGTDSNGKSADFEGASELESGHVVLTGRYSNVLVGSATMNGSIGILAVGNGRSFPLVSSPIGTRPLLVVPGIFASFPSTSSIDTWLTHRGTHPDDLLMDPLVNTYDDLIATLTTPEGGYVKYQSLYPAVYDWRMPPVPVNEVDGADPDGPWQRSLDGVISGVQLHSLGAQPLFEHGIDYLAWWMQLAKQNWNHAHPGHELVSVDVYAHSTGGLVTRGYIQSDVYGTQGLPTVNRYISMAVPNLGASKAWNMLHDNMISDKTYIRFISTIVSSAYHKVEPHEYMDQYGIPHLTLGTPILGPTPADTITLERCDEAVKKYPSLYRDRYEAFLNLYIPTGRALLATYPFIQDGDHFDDINDPTSPYYQQRNAIGLDLNGGFGSGPMASTGIITQLASRVDVAAFYQSSAQSQDGATTFVSVDQFQGPDSLGTRSIVDMFSFGRGRKPEPGELWWKDAQEVSGFTIGGPLLSGGYQVKSGGDLTVPRFSAGDVFLGVPFVRVYEQNGDPTVDHGKLNSDALTVAERRTPFVQRVALKLIKPGMDARWVVSRFEQERQALAVMDHPNIARVIDGGLTQGGRPYFVMEYVQGEPITRYTRRRGLTPREVLELFIPVCEAVQHAHMKGIIHRDLKPSNILVEEIDGKPTPKVIDFGIAKAIDQTSAQRSVVTEEGRMVGTYEYMSPEQAGGEADVDTRTDVYSLGVVLYELLTGVPPFEGSALRGKGYDEIRRIIREVEPPRPSTRMGAAVPAGPDAALRSERDTRALTRLLRQELEWIPLKALRKERDRRYSSPESLADDLRRYLHDEPLNAGPESKLYRARKFVRKNRVPVIAAASVVLALAGGLAVALWQRNAALIAQAAEKARAEELKQVAKFQQDMLRSADPDKVLGDKVTVLQVMQAAVKELDKGSLTDQPLVEAAVRDAIGNTFQALARFDEAEPLLRKTLEIRRKALPREHRAIAESLNNLAVLLWDQNKLAEAELLHVEALGIYRRTMPLNEPATADSLNNLAAVLSDQNKFAEAEPLYREALGIRRKALPPEHPDIASSLNNLAILLQHQYELAEAEPLYREALDIRRKALPPEHPDIASSLDNLATILCDQNKLPEAEPLHREALDIRRKALPPEHPDTANSLNNLANLLSDQNKLAEAEPLYREALDIRRKALPPKHPAIANSLNNLAILLSDQNKLAEAEPLYREALDIYRKTLPPEHPDIADSLNNLARLYSDQNKLAEAEPLYREALDSYRKALPPDHPRIANSLNNLGILLVNQNKLPEAEPLFREALDIRRKALPPEHPDIADSLNNLARLYSDQNKLAEAEPLYREALDIRRKALPPDDPDTMSTTADLGRLLETQARHKETIDLLGPAEAAARSAFADGDAANLASFLTALGRARVGLGYDAERFKLAEANLLEAHPIFVEARGPTHQDTLDCVRGLVDLYTAWDKAEPGQGYDAKAAEWRAKLTPSPDAKDQPEPK